MSGLSEEQRAALAISGDGLVLAGAGAGKTRTLVALCVRDLLAGVAPEEILICTFTRAAAGEIRARLAGELARTETARDIDQARVRAGTIDAICADLVRERALELGLPPSLGLAAAHHTEGIREDAYQVARNALGGRLMELSPLIDPSDDRLLRATIERVFDRAAARGLDPANVVATPAGPGSPDAEELAAALEALAHDAPGAAEAIREDAAFLRLGRAERISDLTWRGLPYTARARANEVRERVRAARILLADPRSATARSALAEMCRHYAAWRRRRSYETGMLGYTDMALACRAGIAAGAITRRFCHVYLDEAQDTNPLQLEILSSLRSPEGRLVAIGDVNQSIYAWRLADPRAFARLRQEFPDVVSLRANHRTSPHLLTGIGAISAGLPELEPGASAMTAACPERPQDPPIGCLFLVEPGPRPADELAEAAAAIDAIEERREALGLGHGEVAVLCRTRRGADRWAEALRGRGIPALVLQRGGVVGTRESVLALDYLGLVADPDDDEALLSVLSGPLARMGGAERAGVFAAPAGGRWPVILQHRRELALALRRHIALRGVLGVEELCRRAIEEIGYLRAWDEADPSGTATRNLAGLIRRIGVLAGDGLGLAEVLAILSAMDEEEGQDPPEPAPPASDLAAVRVMTVHGAKGEEYGLVVLAGMSRRPRWFGSSAEVDAHGQVGVAVRGPNSLVGLIGDAVARRVGAEDEELARAEGRRLAYVGMTRARRGLLMVFSGRVDQDGEPRFEQSAEWLVPVVLPRGDLPLRGEVRREEISPGARIEVERLSPVDLEAGGPADLRPHPDGAGSALPACLSLAEPFLSYTALSDWRRCGLRRHLERDLGLGDPGRPLSAPGGATRLGRRLHRALSRIDWSQPLADEITRATSALGSLGPAERAHAGAVLAALAGLPELTGRLARAGAIHAEERFALAEPLPLVGRIDLRASDGEGLLVVDWKTGADPEERFTDDHSLQQDIYALAALRSNPVPARVELAWVYLADDAPRIDWRSLGQDDIENLTGRINAETARALAMPPRAAATEEQPFCAGCPGLSRVCPVSAGPGDQGGTGGEHQAEAGTSPTHTPRFRRP